MAALGRFAVRLVKYYGTLFVGIALFVAIFQPLVAFIFEEPPPSNGLLDGKHVVGWGILSAAFALFAHQMWRETYLAPRIDLRAAAVRSGLLGRLVSGIAFVEAMVIGLAMPGGTEVLLSQWQWLPEFESIRSIETLGILGLGLILTVVLGVTVQVGDSLEYAWRLRPSHDLGRSLMPR